MQKYLTVAGTTATLFTTARELIQFAVRENTQRDEARY
jgi:hypothetical protein